MAATIRRWREDPVAMVREEFGAEPDPFQLEALKAFPSHNRIAMKACKGPGKTTTEAWCAWNFLATRLHPNIIATSITGDNLMDGLWKEMSKWQQRSAFFSELFEWTKTRIFNRQHPETWWMSARTWPRNADPSAQADALAGIHGDYTLFIFDESGGIPDAVMTTAEASLSTGIENKILQGGNPTMLSGPLYRACTVDRDLWYLITVTGDPDNPNRSPRISLDWAREQINKYGRDNPWVKVNVFGEFPPASLNSLLGPDDIEAAQGRRLEPHQFNFAAKVFGVDVARFGDDRTVIVRRQGLNGAYEPIIMRHERTENIAGTVARMFEEWQGDHIFVDDTGGWGAGVIDALIKLGYPVTPANSSAKAFNPRYMNKRAEMAFEAANWIKKGGGTLPKMPEIIKEATAAEYFYNAGRLQIVEKEIIKDQIGCSPDIWDAYCLTFFSPVASLPLEERIAATTGIHVERCKHEYDPYSEERVNG